MRQPTPLGNIYIEEEVGARAFGTAYADFTRLCTELSCSNFIPQSSFPCTHIPTHVHAFLYTGRNAVWDYPAGCVIINLAKSRTLMLTMEHNFFEPCVVDIEDGLQWMLHTPGVFGFIIRRMRGGLVNCELFAMVFYEEHGDGHVAYRAEKLRRIVESWS